MNIPMTFSDQDTELDAGLSRDAAATFSSGFSGLSVLQGPPGKDGAPGKDGVSCTHLWEGTVLHVTSASGTSSKDLKGAPGKDGYTPVKGKDYFDGAPGKDGVSCTHAWKGTELFVTSASGTSSVDLKGAPGKNGYTPVKGKDYFDGKDGAPGKDGYTPIKGIDYFDGKAGQDGYTPVKGKDYFDGKDGAPGKDGQDGRTPVKGIDYFTEADRAEMVTAVLSALPVYNGEVVSA